MKNYKTVELEIIEPASGILTGSQEPVFNVGEEVWSSSYNTDE